MNPKHFQEERRISLLVLNQEFVYPSRHSGPAQVLFMVNVPIPGPLKLANLPVGIRKEIVRARPCVCWRIRTPRKKRDERVRAYFAAGIELN
jgi:hypothetical protein